MLAAEMSSRSARFGVLATEIEKLNSQIAEDTNALTEAGAIRDKEAAEFHEEEKSLVQAVTNLKNAVAVLAKRNVASFLQNDSSLLSSLRTVLHHSALQYESMLASPKTLPSEKHAALLSVATLSGAGVEHDSLSALRSQDDAGDFETVPLDFAQKIIANALSKASVSSFLQQPATAKEGSYQSNSGPVLGILNQMKEEFESSLSTSQKEHEKMQADYEAMSTAKTAQIQIAKTKLDEMESEHASNQKALSDTKEDLELTRSQHTVDVEFLRNLRLTCQDLDKQWLERSKMRTAETGAISKAIVVITKDDAQELMSSTVTLLQVETNDGAEMLARRNRAVASLRTVWFIRNFLDGRTDPAGPPGTDGRTKKTLKNFSFPYVSLLFFISPCFSLCFLGFPSIS